ncbi:hypothetical protein SAY87_026361 [Trapa incisa]|uniref:Uncharacterized protein n=1 Tax=Trapa incisa TaxID=236973 RepID=A0AAN7JJX4_9MYRT|nr:hypothetical protein SAY87_026361 [Trapa incisa]
MLIHDMLIGIYKEECRCAYSSSDLSGRSESDAIHLLNPDTSFPNRGRCTTANLQIVVHHWVWEESSITHSLRLGQPVVLWCSFGMMRSRFLVYTHYPIPFLSCAKTS